MQLQEHTTIIQYVKCCNKEAITFQESLERMCNPDSDYAFLKKPH